MSLSVLICVYNDECGIENTLRSIVHQTYQNFEVVVINDGSTDKTEMVIKEFSDKRISYHRNAFNIGLTKSLNKGLNLCRFSVVVRIDSGDICEPNRFELQYRYFKERKLNLLGSNARFINVKFPIINNWLLSKPSHHLGIEYFAFFDNPFIHSSVFVDLNFLRSRNLKYNEKFRANQDYDLWTRLLLDNEFKSENMSKRLLVYNFEQNSVSMKNSNAFRNNYEIISQYLYNYFNFNLEYLLKGYLNFVIVGNKKYLFHSMIYLFLITLLYLFRNPGAFFIVAGIFSKILAKHIVMTFK